MALIYIVEDDADIRGTVADLLAEEGHAVLTANKGGSGLQMMNHARRPDLLIVDLALPDFDGLEFLDRLDENPDWRKIPCLIISANPQRARERSFQRSVSVLAKPFSLNQLGEAVDHAIGATH